MAKAGSKSPGPVRSAKKNSPRSRRPAAPRDPRPAHPTQNGEDQPRRHAAPSTVSRTGRSPGTALPAQRVPRTTTAPAAAAPPELSLQFLRNAVPRNAAKPGGVGEQWGRTRWHGATMTTSAVPSNTCGRPASPARRSLMAAARSAPSQPMSGNVRRAPRGHEAELASSAELASLSAELALGGERVRRYAQAGAVQ